MSTLQVTFNGQNYTFAPGAVVRIGRSSENDIVVNEPTVSRRHAQLAWEAAGWVWQNAGQSPTFLGGQPVAQFAVGQAVDIRLASPQGPVLRLATDAGHGVAGPGGTERAVGLGQTNVAGGQAPAGYAAGYADAGPPAAAAAAAGAAAAGAGAAGAPAGFAGPGAPGYEASPGYQPPGPGYPGGPGYQGAPGNQGAPGYQGGAGYQAGPGYQGGGPGYPGG